MYLPYGEHHALLNRDRRAQLLRDTAYAAEHQQNGLPIAQIGPGIIQRLRRLLGNGLIRIGRWVRGPVGPFHSRPVVNPW